MPTFDYIADARGISDALGNDLAEWKTRIEEVITTGSTGTEILMGLRWNMAELLKAKPALPPDVVARIKDYLIAANKLLG